MNRKLLKLCEEKRKLLKGEIWRTDRRQQTASLPVRVEAEQELKLHGINTDVCIACGTQGRGGLIEVAHGKASSSFPDDSLVGSINHIDNLIPLCKNCHAKFDSSRKDERWAYHTLKVLIAWEKQIKSHPYIFTDIEYPSPIDLQDLKRKAESVFYYRSWIHVPTSYVIENDGLRYKIPDFKLYEKRELLHGDCIDPEAKNGTRVGFHRTNSREEAFRHGMYNSEAKCMVCPENWSLEVSHAVSLKNFKLDVPLGVVNNIWNLIWLCRNHHHIFDHPERFAFDPKFEKEYRGMMKTLQEQLIIHRQKYTQIPINGKSYIFNPVDVNNWSVIEDSKSSTIIC